MTLTLEYRLYSVVKYTLELSYWGSWQSRYVRVKAARYLAKVKNNRQVSTQSYYMSIM